MIRKIRCPWCRSTANKAYKTNGIVQYRRCFACHRLFKAILEPADEEPPTDQNQPGARGD